jgi:hypothetical protein
VNERSAPVERYVLSHIDGGLFVEYPPRANFTPGQAPLAGKIYVVWKYPEEPLPPYPVTTHEVVWRRLPARHGRGKVIV